MKTFLKRKQLHRHISQYFPLNARIPHRVGLLKSKSSMLSVAVQNWLVNIHQHYLSSSSPIWFSQNVGHAAPDEARLGLLLAMVHCYTKMELFVPAFSTLGIYRAAAADVLIKKAQTLMSNGLHTTLHLTHACSLTESQGTFSGPVRNSRLRQIELR